MRSIRIILIVLAGVHLSGGSKATAQRGDQGLPAPDPVIQSWVQALSQRPTSRTYETHVKALMEANETKDQKRLTDDAWLDQVMIFMLKLPDADQRWQAGLNLMWNSQAYLRVDIVPRLKYLAARLDSTDGTVVRVADELIRASFAAYSSDIFSIMNRYLGGLKGEEPSWKLVRRMYDVDPDMAMSTAADVYFANRPGQFQPERAIRLGLEKDRKEIRYLLLSYELAPGNEKAGWSEKVLAKLTALAGHPHWMVRGYAAAVIRRERLNSLDGGNSWLEDPALMEKLRGDANPFVSETVKEIGSK